MNASPLQAALYLAEEYGVPVFPCGPDKRPYTTHGFKDAATTIEAIEHLWNGHPDALVAVPTGKLSRCLVIDIDPAGKGWYQNHLAELKCGRVHHTRRGVHLLYRYPEGVDEIRNSTGKLASGVDVRGEGGYVIWWPAHGLKTVGDLEDLTEPPPWLLEQLVAAGKKPSKPNGHDENGGSIGEGRRNDYLSGEAYRLRKQGSTPEQILVVLRAINTARCRPPLEDSELEQIARGKEHIAPEAPGIVLRHLADIVAERREARWLRGLDDTLEHGVLAVLAGSRNTFKSLIALRWMLTAALNGEAVVILSAEGSGLDRRADAYMRTYAPALDLRSLQVLALEHAVNLNASAVLEGLCAAIDAHGMKPAAITVDTFSKFAPGLDENDNTEVAAFLSILSAGLRNRYGCTVLLVAHAGHGDSKRPRGASVLMANPDAEYIVERASPTDMAVTVTRERFKDSPALPQLAYSAEVVDLGRLDSRGKPVTSLVLRDADLATVRASNPQAGRKLTGKYVTAMVAALSERHRAHPETGGLISFTDLRAIATAQKVDRRRYQDTVEKLTDYGWLAPALGGHRFAPEDGGNQK